LKPAALSDGLELLAQRLIEEAPWRAMFSWSDLPKFLLGPFIQCYLCQFDTNAARWARMAILPVSLKMAWNYAEGATFEPRHGTSSSWRLASSWLNGKDYVPLNFALIGISAAYGMMKSVEWAFAPTSDFCYSGAHPPSNQLSWAFHLFTSMRGINWAWGTEAKKLAPPYSSHIPTFLRQTAARIFLFHLLVLAGSIPILQAAHAGGMVQLLREYLPPFACMETAAWIFEGLLLGVTWWVALVWNRI
jgi:hypothetical protein